MECMEPELSGIFQLKLVVKKVVLGSPGTHVMHKRVKNDLSKLTYRKTLIDPIHKATVLTLIAAFMMVKQESMFTKMIMYITIGAKTAATT